MSDLRIRRGTPRRPPAIIDKLGMFIMLYLPSFLTYLIRSDKLLILEQPNLSLKISQYPSQMILL